MKKQIASLLTIIFLLMNPSSSFAFGPGQDYSRLLISISTAYIIFGPTMALNETIQSSRHQLGTRAREAILAAGPEAYAYIQNPTEMIPANLANTLTLIDETLTEDNQTIFRNLSPVEKVQLVADLSEQFQNSDHLE